MFADTISFIRQIRPHHLFASIRIRRLRAPRMAVYLVLTDAPRKSNWDGWALPKSAPISDRFWRDAQRQECLQTGTLLVRDNLLSLLHALLLLRDTVIWVRASLLGRASRLYPLPSSSAEKETHLYRDIPRHSALSVFWTVSSDTCIVRDTVS